MTKPAELYACLYASELPAQALSRLRPELRDLPCVVMEGEPPMQFVCSLNTRARLLGMKIGMTRVEVETFPAGVALSRSLRMEVATKAILLECAGAFSPRVEDRSEDAAFLCGIDIAGTRNLFGSPEMLTQSLQRRIRNLGVSVRIIVSSNFHAAVCLAKGLSPSTSIHVIAPHEEAAALEPLPLSVLNLTETQKEIFASWGIDNLGMLAALPDKNLIARMGQDAKRLLQLARGEHPHLFQPVEPEFTLEERLELDSPLEQLESLLFGINIMLEQLILRAQARVVALASVTLALSLEGGGIHTRRVRPALPSTDKRLWLKLLQLDLEAHPPQAAVLAASLRADPGSISKVQLGLFSPQLPESSRLDVTLARIRALVGEENAGRAVLKDTHAMEGYRMEPFSMQESDSFVIPPAQPRACLRQIRPAEAVRVTTQSYRPAEFNFRQRRYIVEHAYGPWLAEGNWWDQSWWGFEHWDLIARAQEGSLLCCCIIRDLLHDRWQMAGLYD